MLTAVTTTLDQAPAAVHSLVDRDEYGPITGRPGGLFTAPAVPLLLADCDDIGRRLADWVPGENLL